MATYEGNGLCSIQEYQTAFDRRLQVEQLTRGELYVARFALKNFDKAYRVIGRVGITAELGDDKNMLPVQLLHKTLEPIDDPYIGFIKDGVWNSVEWIDYVWIAKGIQARILNGCFRDYEDGVDIDDDVIRKELNMPSFDEALATSAQ